MQGVSVNERSRELTHMNKFSEKSVALLVADTIRLSRDGSRRGRLSHGAAFSVELSRIMHLDSRGLFPLPFPAAQPASAPAGRDEDVHAGPDFGRRAALEMLMRTKVIVEASCVGQGSIQRHSVLNGMPEEQPFDGPDETFDAAVLPGASRIAVLQANPYVPQGQAKRLRGEHRFVVGAQESWAAVMTTRRDEVAPDRQRRLICHSLHSQTGATGMVQDGQGDMPAAVGIGFRQQIHAPDQVTRDGARDARLEIVT